MKFLENQTIMKTKEETMSNDLKIKPNIFLYIIFVTGAILVGDIAILLIEYFIFGGENFLKESVQASDIYNIVSLIGQILPISFSLLVAKKLLNRSNFSLGIRKENFIKDYFQGIILSIFQLGLIVSLAYLLNSATLSINYNVKKTYVLLFTLGWVIQGFSEELICRSLFMNGFTAFGSVKSAILLNSLIFSLIHIGNNSVNIIALINLFLSGITYSLIFYLKDSIWTVAAAHSFWNMIQGNIFGISVSGFAIAKSSIFSTDFLGSNLITGGEFGIEASLLCTLAELLVIIFVYNIIKKKSLIID
ncbi:MAG: CPBP family intramembrane glutamic endopeptidase [Anaerococcus sp.]